MEDGVLSVLKSNFSLDRLRDYLVGFCTGKVASITSIYSKGIQTNNYIVLMSRELYNLLIGSTKYIIQSISPYLISDKQLPKNTQNTNIFLRFEYLDSENVDTHKIESSIKSTIKELVDFNIIDDIKYLIFVSDVKHSRKIGTITFLQDVSLDTAIYIRSLLNGYIIDSIKVKISAYWCADENESNFN